MSLLELRNQMNKRKPAFIRQDFHKKRLRKRWVRPRGLHSKVALKRSGHPRRVSTGYGSPREVRGLSREGLIVKVIFNEKELDGVNKEKDGIIVSTNVGMKKKMALLKKAKERGVKVLNINADEYMKRKEEEIKERLEKKKEKKDKKKEEKKKAKGEKLEEKLSEEDKKEKDKKEKDKLLTKREV